MADNWTAAEKQLHDRGRALMQSARDTRRNRIEREAEEARTRVSRQAAAQKAADDKYALDKDKQITAFMSDFASLLGKHNLVFMPMQETWSAGMPDVPVFKVVARGEYKAPDYTVSVRPGVGFNWKK